MNSARLEAFTDGVVAIIITIMVLEIHVPQGHDLASLKAEVPLFLAYVLSYVNVGIFWNNHHHMLHATERVDGKVLWANLGLLFWLSLVPFVIRWIDESGFTPLPTAAYGIVLACAAVGRDSSLRGRGVGVVRARQPHRGVDEEMTVRSPLGDQAHGCRRTRAA